jgi:DNA-binding NtrC family response regulator
MQVKLLRLLQEGTYERVGGDRPLKFAGRVIAATHRPLDTDRTGFRDDIYYRLAACVIRTPPLRERRADVPNLAVHLLERALAEMPQAPAITLDAACDAWLIGQEWPGNVRELENALRRAVGRALADGSDRIRPEHFQAGHRTAGDTPANWDLSTATDAFQKDLVSRALAVCDGNRTRAAQRLGVSRPWLYKLLGRWEDLG